MYNPNYDGPRDPSAPEHPPQPGLRDPGPVEFIGYDPQGLPVYRGADGSMWTDDASGVNGLGAYSGPGVTGGKRTDVDTTPTPTPTPTGPGALGSFAPPAPLPMPGLPTFTPPPAFEDPSMADVEGDAGYTFARDEGQKALERSHAAGATLNTGGTLKDIAAWAGNYANQRYGDVRNRKKDTYMTNYQTQYIDPYQLAYTSALGQGAWNQHANDMNWQHEFDLWNRQHDNAYQYFTS